MALMQSPVLGRLSPFVNPKLSPETVTLMEHFIIWQNINSKGTINDTGNHAMILLIRPAYTFGSEERDDLQVQPTTQYVAYQKVTSPPNQPPERLMTKKTYSRLKRIRWPHCRA